MSPVFIPTRLLAVAAENGLLDWQHSDSNILAILFSRRSMLIILPFFGAYNPAQLLSVKSCSIEFCLVVLVFIGSTQ